MYKLQEQFTERLRQEMEAVEATYDVSTLSSFRDVTRNLLATMQFSTASSRLGVRQWTGQHRRDFWNCALAFGRYLQKVTSDAEFGKSETQGNCLVFESADPQARRRADEEYQIRGFRSPILLYVHQTCMD